MVSAVFFDSNLKCLCYTKILPHQNDGAEVLCGLELFYDGERLAFLELAVDILIAFDIGVGNHMV